VIRGDGKGLPVLLLQLISCIALLPVKARITVESSIEGDQPGHGGSADLFFRAMYNSGDMATDAVQTSLQMSPAKWRRRDLGTTQFPGDRPDRDFKVTWEILKHRRLNRAAHNAKRVVLKPMTQASLTGVWISDLDRFVLDRNADEDHNKT
jgi:hypothetical protein